MITSEKLNFFTELQRLINNVPHARIQGYDKGDTCQFFCPRCNLEAFYKREFER